MLFLLQVAAQNCRRRKIDQIAQLEHQVEEARVRKERLMDERQQLYRQREQWAMKLSEVEEDILVGLNKNMKDFTLDAMAPDVRVVRREPQAAAGAIAREHVREKLGC